MKFTKYILLLTLATLVSTCNGQGNSQNIDERITVKSKVEIDGKANFIYQDSKANFWFASNQGGIYKFDGRSVEKFTKIEGLTEFVVLRIEEDTKGDLFFDTPGGIFRFNGSTFEKLKVIQTKNGWQSQPTDLWFSMGVEKSGPLRYDGEHLYQLIFPKSPNEKDFRAIAPNSTVNPYGIYSIYKAKNGTLFFGTSNVGICAFDGTKCKWIYDKFTTDTRDGGSFGIRSITQDKTGNFWINRADQKFELPPSDQNQGINFKKAAGLTNNELQELYFLDMLTDTNGNIWMASYDNGIFRFDGQHLSHYFIRVGKEKINLSAWNALTLDRKGNLWVGTQENGAFKFDGTDFEKYKPK